MSGASHAAARQGGGDGLAAPEPAPVRWLRSFALMTLWEIRSLRFALPFAIVVQILVGAGLVVGFGFVIGEIPTPQALYLTTGLTVVSMITIGMVLAPQLIAQQKLAGVYDYIWSLPVPKSAAISAALLVNALIATPGIFFTLAAGAWRYDLTYSISPSLLPAALLTLICAASIGFALAHAIPDPMITGLLTQVLMFAILLYSPINFPPDQLPEWLALIHRYLPFQHAANVMRASLTEGLATEVARSFGVLGLWALGSWLLTGWVVGRRS